METQRTKLAKALRVAAVTLGAALFLAALGWAGESDRRDAVLAEMRNNGAFSRLEAAYPDADEAELVKLYEHGKSERN